MTTIRRFLKILKHNRWKFGLALLSISLCSIGFLAIPIIVKDIVGTAVSNAGETVSLEQGLLLLGIVAASAVTGSVSFLLIFDVAHRVTARLRGDYIACVLRAPMEFHRKEQIGTLIDGLTTSLNDIEWFIKYSLTNIAGVGVMLIGGGIMMFVLSWQLALLVILTVCPTAFLLRSIYRRARQMSREAKTASENLIGRFHSLLLGIEIVKAFNTVTREIIRFRKKQDRLLAIQRRTGRVIAIVEPVLMTLSVITFLLLLLYGGHLIAVRGLSPDKVIAFMLYLLIIMPQARTLSLQLSRWQQAGNALDRLENILNTPREKDAPDAIPLSTPIRPEIEFKGVVYWYADREHALDGVSLKIHEGERVGIVGESGAGKTTLFNLLLRFYTPREGKIYIGGTDIQRVTAESLRECIAVVPQDIMLFNDTVLENVRYGRTSASDEEVRSACKAAQIESFIKSLPEDYRTLLGDRGMNVSAGQRQRLAIARGLLKNAPILLLDEATSALDTHTERQLRDAMEAVMQGRTTLIIAHRLGTVVHLPRIIVLSGGRILADGSHEELVQSCAEYKNLITTQLIPMKNVSYSSTPS